MRANNFIFYVLHGSSSISVFLSLMIRHIGSILNFYVSYMLHMSHIMSAHMSYM